MVRRKETAMADKDRQKKDGERTDKKNKRMRESIGARYQEEQSERERQKHEAKMTDSMPEGEARLRKKN
jgi:hypothetical protein